MVCFILRSQFQALSASLFHPPINYQPSLSPRHGTNPLPLLAPIRYVSGPLHGSHAQDELLFAGVLGGNLNGKASVNGQLPHQAKPITVTSQPVAPLRLVPDLHRYPFLEPPDLPVALAENRLLPLLLDSEPGDIRSPQYPDRPRRRRLRNTLPSRPKLPSPSFALAHSLCHTRLYPPIAGRQGDETDLDGKRAPRSPEKVFTLWKQGVTIGCSDCHVASAAFNRPTLYLPLRRPFRCDRSCSLHRDQMSSSPLQQYHPDDSQRHLRYNLISCLTVSVVFVLVRVLVRTQIQRQFALDDYLLVLAICCFSMMTGFIVYAIDAGGFGQVSGKIPLEVLIRGSKYLVFAQLFNVLTQTITNLSIAVLQLRISGGVYVTFKRVHYASITLNVCTGLAQFFSLLFRCYPVSKAWTPTMKGGHCTEEDAIAIRGYVFCACNVILTWYYALAPIHLVGKLQLRLSVKLSSIFVLSVGILASIAQIMKFKYLLGFSDAPNPLKAFTPLAIFCWIELCLAISAASISTFRPLFKFMPGCAMERSPKYPPTVDTEPKMRLRRGYTFQLSEIDSMSIKHDELHMTETFDLENPIPTALTTPGPVEEISRLGYFDEYTSPGAGKTKGRPLPDLEKGM